MKPLGDVLNRMLQASLGALFCLASARIFAQRWLIYVAIVFLVYTGILLIYAGLIYWQNK